MRRLSAPSPARPTLPCMTRTPSPQDALERLRRLNEDRMASAQTLIEARQAVAETEAAKAAAAAEAQRIVDKAEAVAAEAYAVALKAGWSDSELRGVGLPAPVKPRAKRTRVKAKGSDQSAAPAAPAAPDHDQVPDGERPS